MQKIRDAPAGFTLIELPVVIAIVALGHARWIGPQSRRLAKSLRTRRERWEPVPPAN